TARRIVRIPVGLEPPGSGAPERCPPRTLAAAGQATAIAAELLVPAQPGDDERRAIPSRPADPWHPPLRRFCGDRIRHDAADAGSPGAADVLRGHSPPTARLHAACGAGRLDAAPAGPRAGATGACER